MTGLRGLFVTGTDTGVGKTRVAAAIASVLANRGVRVGVLKPVATGAEPVGDGWRAEDAELLISAIGGRVPSDRVCPIAFQPPLAPPVAARLSGEPLGFDRVLAETRTALDWWAGPGGAELVVVEGVGGLLCPLAEGATVADLAVSLDFPVLVVARRGLGTLNHTLLTVEAARRRGLRLAGVVLNGSEPTVDPLAERTNPGELARWLGDVPLLADLPHGAGLAALLGGMIDLDWNGRALTPRIVGIPDRLAGGP
ncbi:dethiobiotin synthase [Tautonia sociabilis]|uniref:ATP-dependent dethiobiotin synthetase BioD n=1 Tax=Tautonia sociabilis TaxID=2080755 RepID=A0A432MIW8_9BACT|nr:dethiobiotin synthase [Tautonia sociabilis]RUL87314.1 dethiobiotin synthase [Tautonia sociabilis]